MTKYGFEYRNRITIWKEPLKVRMRTMVPVFNAQIYSGGFYKVFYSYARLCFGIYKERRK